MTALPLILVLGRECDPTTSLLGDLRRLPCRAELIPWPARLLRWRGPRPLAVMVDWRTLGAEAAQAIRAVRSDPGLRERSLVAVIHEQEAASLDLSLGPDDLLLSPYRASDLLARLRLLRWRQEKQSADLLRAGPLTLNPATYQVLIHGLPVDLTLKEYQLLLFLLRHPDRVHSRIHLLDQVWGADYYGGARTVDVHIRRLRAKTEAAGDLIETVRGVGYRLALPR